MTDPVDIEVGDMLHPLSLWNRSERPENQLPDPVEVLDIAVDRKTQTGIVLLVRTRGGGQRWLDSGWFKR